MSEDVPAMLSVSTFAKTEIKVWLWLRGNYFTRDRDSSLVMIAENYFTGESTNQYQNTKLLINSTHWRWLMFPNLPTSDSHKDLLKLLVHSLASLSSQIVLICSSRLLLQAKFFLFKTRWWMSCHALARMCCSTCSARRLSFQSRCSGERNSTETSLLRYVTADCWCEVYTPYC